MPHAEIEVEAYSRYVGEGERESGSLQGGKKWMGSIEQFDCDKVRCLSGQGCQYRIQDNQRFFLLKIKVSKLSLGLLPREYPG